MKESLQNIRDIILKPSAVFTRLKFEPKWLLALTLCCIGFVAVESATRPFEEHILSHTAAQEGDDANKAQTSDAIIGIVIDSIIGIVVACVVLPSLFVVSSTFFLALARLFRINRTVLKFSHIYVSVVHIALIGMLGSIVNTVLLLIFKSPQDIQRELDMVMIPGLHHLATRHC